MPDHWEVIEDALTAQREHNDEWGYQWGSDIQQQIYDRINAALAFVREQRAQLAGLTPDVSEIRNASPAPSLYARTLPDNSIPQQPTEGELLPCPHCGSEAYCEKKGNSVAHYVVLCKGCRVKMIGTKEADAVNAWNRRVPTATQAATVQGQPLPDWSTAPAWAMWWAVDADDNATWFQNRPFCIGSGWVNPGGMTVMYNTMLPYHLPLGIDWRTTLTQRPQPTDEGASHE